MIGLSTGLRVYLACGVTSLRKGIAGADCKAAKQAFGANSEKIQREIEQLELALEDLSVAMAEGDGVHMTRAMRRRRHR